ncbi:MAG: ORF6N domain-containing protein [Chitinophagaceae bacterium]|nr:ORF6N domain-containing protein [Chitinophagaceae bacterium]
MVRETRTGAEDKDIALLYGVTIKRLNEQVKRNKGRFPEDFKFQLTPHEKEEVVAKCDHKNNLKFSHQLPFATASSPRSIIHFAVSRFV